MSEALYGNLKPGGFLADTSSIFEPYYICKEMHARAIVCIKLIWKLHNSPEAIYNSMLNASVQIQLMKDTVLAESFNVPTWFALKCIAYLKSISQNKGKEKENSYRKFNRSPEERHTQTHGNLFKIF
jgi:hypothetical protein